MNGPSLDWLPSGRIVAMRPAGQWWDAIRVPRYLGETVLAALGDQTGAVIEDPNGALLYWFVEPGRARDWQLTPVSGIASLGAPTHVAVPGPQRTSGPHWRIPPSRRRCLTDPQLLCDALRAAVDANFGPRKAAR